MSRIIELAGVHKIYQSGETEVHAVRDISLSIDPGEFIAVMGASGSGKSSLMNILGCLDPPTRGSYRLAGVDVTGLDRDALADIRRSRLGFIFQGFNLIARTTALENVEVPMLGHGLSAKEVRHRAEESLARVGLAERAGHMPHQLSGGQQQRVAIARALVNSPELILADEPTGNLDTQTSVDIMRLFQQLNDEGITFVMVTHEPDIARYCTRNLTIRDGQLIQDAPVTDRLIAVEQRNTKAHSQRAQSAASKRQEAVANVVGMDLFITIWVALRNLRRAPLRSALTTLGIIIGVAAVIAMIAIGNGSRMRVAKSMAEFDANRFTINAQMPRHLWPKGQYLGVPPTDGLKVADYDAIRREVRGLVAASIQIVARATGVTANGRSSDAMVLGMDAEGWKLSPRKLLEGTVFGSRDVKRAATVCIVTEDVAKSLYPKGSPIGRRVRVNNASFVIIGVLEGGGLIDQSRPELGDNVVVVPYTSVLQRLYRSTPISIVVKPENPAELGDVQRQVNDLLERRRGNRKAEFNGGNIERAVRNYRESNQAMVVLLFSIGSISLLVGGIGIANIMMVTVAERTKEIGTRMAIGTRTYDILRQFLLEALVLSVLGGLVGIILGVGSAFVLTSFFQIPTQVTLGSVTLAFMCSVGVGIAFGFYPARQASRLNPIEALRSE